MDIPIYVLDIVIDRFMFHVPVHELTNKAFVDYERSVSYIDV